MKAFQEKVFFSCHKNPEHLQLKHCFQVTIPETSFKEILYRNWQVRGEIQTGEIFSQIYSKSPKYIFTKYLYKLCTKYMHLGVSEKTLFQDK